MNDVADGIPKVPIATELETCPICAHAKLRKAARGKNSSRRATACCQGLSIDVGFMVQSSSTDCSRVRRLMGLNGETCYVLIECHKSQQVFGGTFRSKAPPIDYLNKWLLQRGLDDSVKDKYVRFDPGGDLGGCTEIVDLFENAGYKVEVTAPDSSHMNGPVERPHQTIADAIRTMLAGADLEPKFWPYAFHHFLRLYNVTLHRGNDKTPYEICSGQRPNLRHLRTFGCRVYAIPNRPRRDAKAVSDSRVGIFLGYSKTMKKILYYDIDTETVKESQHVRFDEGMNDLDVKPPNARLLDGLRNQDPDVMKIDIPLPALDVSTRAFLGVETVTVQLDLSDDAPFGFEFDKCSRLQRAHVSRVLRRGTGTKHRSLKTFKAAFHGAYVVSIDDSPVFTLGDIAKVVTRLRRSRNPPDTIEIVLAPERKSDYDDRPGPLHLRLADLRRVCALQSVAGEGKDFADAISAYAADMCPYEMTAAIRRLQTAGMTDEERKLNKFTRRNLQKLSNWDDWDECHDAQLDAHHES